MEDKWLIYLADNQLHFHRSWTGHCIFTISVMPRAGRLYLDQCTVNGDREQFDTESFGDIASEVRSLIEHLLVQPFDLKQV
jgi:hypothetical protein